LSRPTARSPRAQQTPILALWDENSGGDAGTVSSCTDILDRYVTPPSNALATQALDRLHSACAALEDATNIKKLRRSRLPSG
jgi:hypothetical protein